MHTITPSIGKPLENIIEMKSNLNMILIWFVVGIRKDSSCSI